MTFNSHRVGIVTGALLLLWLLPVCVTAAPRAKKVTVEYTFVAGHNMSLAQAKQEALRRAQLQAIADEFGTIISQTTTTATENIQKGQGARSNVQVISLGQSDVRGEWVRTDKEPAFSIRHDEELGMIIIVKVSGEIRERVSAEIDLKALVLRNGTTGHFQDQSFLSGDDLYLLFQSPADGYLAVYLTDVDNAYCLLPYQNQKDAVMPIEKNSEYVFFSVEQAREAMKPVVDEYHLTCGQEMELNRIYIIFSRQEFTKAVDDAGGMRRGERLPRTLTLKEFHRWLGKARAHDEHMTCKAIDIDIRPQ